MSDFDFSLIAQAGLTQQDAADYLGVSRVTVNYWVQGRVEPHPWVRDEVGKFLAKLKAGLDEERLPIQLPDLREVTRASRRAALEEVLS
jgi:transcriptional regulator with XRE-family HTH domain